MANNRFQTLSFTQVEKLDAVIGERRFIHSRNKAILSPTIDFALRNFIVMLRDRICKYGIHMEEIRLNGGAASYILGEDTVPTFNDLDIIFKLSIAGEAEFEIIRIAVLECLREYLPPDTDSSRVNENNLAGAYVDKMIKIWTDKDRWSLISLGLRPNNVELKFVCQMVREYQFSVDSFQIMLDPLLTFYSISSRPISEHFFPTIVAESVYGSFSEAFGHLKNRLIATCSPENIRGGGLLRYCDLLVKGYQPVEGQNFTKKEQYMCTRFFIDFMDVPEQARQISGYLQNHFFPSDPRKFDYLKILESVIDRSAVCLMNQERQFALDVVARLANYELRWRETFVPAYMPLPAQFGYYYQANQHPQRQGSSCLSSVNQSGFADGSVSMLSNGRITRPTDAKMGGVKNAPAAAVNSQYQSRAFQPVQRPNNIFYCHPQAVLQCRCQQCLGQFSPEHVNENSLPGTVCCVPVWISPNRLYPPSPLVVIAGTPIAMSSPSGSSSLSSNGFGPRATPSPSFPTTPVSMSIPNASIEYDESAMTGDIIDDQCASEGVCDSEIMSSASSSASENVDPVDADKIHLLNDDSGVETLSTATVSS